ncbi:MAG TPA: HEAT repeat domain-containing protein [Sedimentisphaerales bacterium]|nr:HEAT repeat domain-containing protein [Sedimentisphaerales bacterium]
MWASKLRNAHAGVSVAEEMTAKSHDAQNKAVDELLTRIVQGSDEVRTEAWLSAGEIAAPAVKPLAALMTDKELEVGRAAKRGLWKIVRRAGRPGAGQEKKAVTAELTLLLGQEQPIAVRREVLWMLSEIGGDESVAPIAALMSNTELREHARMTLERIPGAKSLAALKTAMKNAPKDFKPNLAQSLRQRGVKVRGVGCVKLVPTKKTNVKPAASKQGTSAGWLNVRTREVREA